MKRNPFDAIRGSDLFRFIPETSLVEVASDEKMSVYDFACGCVALRQVESDDCFVRWCDEHPKS